MQNGQMAGGGPGMGQPLPNGGMAEQPPYSFPETMFGAVAGVDRRVLEELAQLAHANDTLEAYLTYQEGLRRLGWATLSAKQAISMETYFLDTFSRTALPIDAAAQMIHTKSITEVILNIKSALDALALCFDKVLELGNPRARIDLRWSDFRDKVVANLPDLRDTMNLHAGWLDERRQGVDSIYFTADQWIHRIAPVSMLCWPPIDGTGCLPVSTSGRNMMDPDYDPAQDTFVSTTEFLNTHLAPAGDLYDRAARAFISKERVSAPDLRIRPAAQGEAAFTPLLVTRAFRVTGMQSGPLAAQLFGSSPNQRQGTTVTAR